MALTPGSPIGVYEITAPLGEGGMGQVWRATDTTLGRIRPFVSPLSDASSSAPATEDKSTNALRSGSGQGGDGQWQVSSEGGIFPTWRADGKELYYLNPSGAMVAVPIAANGSALEAGTPVVLFPTSILGGGVDVQAGRQYDVAPDGRFLINTVVEHAAAPITIIQNWNPEGKK